MLANFGRIAFGGGNKTQKRQEKKQELLTLIKPLKRGLTASKEQQQDVEAVCRELERLNPTPDPLTSPLLSGRWRLEYTTSQSILGASKPALLRPSGPIYQLIDGTSLRAANKESAPLFNQVYAELSPMTKDKVAVQFKVFKLLGFIPIQAPPSARGELQITFLDEELRISRGDKGNLFVLEMDDPEDRAVQP